MAEPIDTAVILEDVEEILQEKYLGEFEEQYTRMGRTTNKLFQPASSVAGGDGITLQTEIAPGDTVRPSNTILSGLAAPDHFEPAAIKARYSEDGDEANDFTRFSARARVTDPQVRNAGNGAIVDLVERVYNQIVPQYEESLAIYRHAGRTARIGLVNGTPRQAGALNFAQATQGGVTNATGIRFKVDSSSISYFRRGTRLDIKAPGGAYRAQNVRVTHVNPADLSVQAAFVAAGAGVNPTRVSSGNVTAIADNDEVYFSGTFNQGMFSLGEFYTRPATGDSYVGGKNRLEAGNMWLNPVCTREGEARAKITKAMFDDLAQAMNFQSEKAYGVVLMSNIGIVQTLRQELGEASFIPWPSDSQQTKRFMHFGSVGLLYQHPAFGLVQIAGDVLHPDDRVSVITPQSWRAQFYGFRGLTKLTEGGSHWYRMEEPTPGQGKSLIHQADWYSIQMDWCLNPWLNGAILNVSAT